MLSDASILITGGAGFIGSTLASRLIDDNRVTVFDSFRRDALSATGLTDHPNLTVVEGDILDEAALTAAARGHTHVVHCAAIAGIDTVGAHPVTTMRVNTVGSANVLAAAHEAGTAQRVVCFSTSEVFGRRAFRVAEHDDANIGAVGEPRWTYAVSKLAEEHLAIAYFTEHALPVTVVRPFNVYGPGQVGEGAMRMFIERAIENEPIIVHGDGSQIRAWCYVDDMVRAVLLALEHPGAVGESFNIGNARATATMSALAHAVVRLTGSRSTIEHRAHSGPDIDLRVPCTDKAADIMGFRAEVDLDEGIVRTADWMRRREEH